MSNRVKEAACEDWDAGGSYLQLLGTELCDKLIKGRTVKFFKKKDIVMRRAAGGNQFLLVRSGQIKVAACLVDGREFVVDTLASGGVFGELDVLRRTPSPFEAHALSACEIWLLDGTIVRDAAMRDAVLSNNLLQHVSAQAQKLETRLLTLASASISFRLANALLRLGQLDSPFPQAQIYISQQELASMLPASREKVNRCLRYWERSRIVHLAPGSITITNPRALHDYATA
jgi:CRP/FNR family transcriptional regulator, cyclic AMP receptor protein